MGLAAVLAAALGFGALSSVLPLFDSETYLVAFGVTQGHTPTFVSAVGLGVGQMVGKAAIFVLVRRGRMAASTPGGFHDSLLTATRRFAGWWQARRSARAMPSGASTAQPPAQSTGAVHLGRPGDLSGGVSAGVSAGLSAGPGAAAVPVPGPSRWRVLRALVVRWGERGLELLDRPFAATGVVVVSATVGFPPLAITTVAAGFSRMPWPVFFGATLVGRLGRFLVLAYVISFVHH